MKLPWPMPGFAAAMTLAVVAMLALQAWVEYRWLPPQAAQMRQLEQSVQAHRIASATRAAPVAAPQERLQGILARLAQVPSAQERIERIHKIAADQAVVVRKASYHKNSVSGLVVRHEVQADLSGGYPAIRQFLRELMKQDEALAIESIELSRPAGSVGVRAQVRLVLFSPP
ncbi:MAG: hypothetical protein AUJ20_08530 [Comamonadaceae bacterium CG1_02_60_18]|nr:MAG: hypothetical protein AUJ20_08530 [Comamonadaceae bacterium CG1_02_60_18]PIQ52224.1 MAG: hypothetical protein COW02_10670 [Comamonadaceae bacterium CG12_big_fil_rev_8_21_14_0_65_59_15]